MVGYATDYAGESTSTGALRDTLRRIAEAGFSHIHWCHEWDGDYTYSQYEMLQIRQWMDEFGLKSKGFHATEGSRRRNVEGKYKYRWEEQNRRDYTSENELNRLAGVELIRNRVEMARVLGASEIVLHMQLPYASFEADSSFRERYYGQICKSFDELREECKAKGVRICVENLLGTPLEHQYEQFDRLFARYEPEFLGFCFDTGHAFIVSEEGDMLALARRYKERMFAIHMSDNLGLASRNCWQDDIAMTRCDLHRNPFQGAFDWEGFARVLAESAYEPPVVLEVSRRDADDAAFLRESLEAGERFTELFLKYRKQKNS